MVAPVALAMRRRSSFLHRRTAMAPASTNSLRHKSSMPLVVRMTLAPEARILRTRSSVMSDSLQGRQHSARSAGGAGGGGGDEDAPLADGLELLRVIDGDVHTEVHARLLQVHVEARNLGARDARLHRCRCDLGRQRHRREYLEEDETTHPAKRQCS